VFHPVPRNVNDDDPESKVLEIVLVFKTFVGGHQNVAPALGLGDQLGVRERAPFGLGDGQYFMIRESLPQARVNALV
jgi:hypothetical protein